MPGGQGGSPFSTAIPAETQLSAVRVRCAERLDQIRLEYIYKHGNSGVTDIRGGNGGTPFTFYLEKDECIVAVLIWAGDKVDALQFKTNRGRSSPKYGGKGGKLFTFFAPAERQALGGFSGRSGSEIDNLQPIWASTNLDTPDGLRIISDGPVGGNGGWSFSDFCEIDDARTAVIQSIAVRSGAKVDQIQVTYVYGPECAPHGGDGGSRGIFALARGEYITRIEGRATQAIDQLQFFTNTGRSSDVFGGNGGDPFRWTAPGDHRLVYFDGRSGAILDQLTANWQRNPPQGHDVHEATEH